MAGDYRELIEYLDVKFSDVEVRFNDLKSNFAQLAEGVDVYAKRADAYFQEMAMLARKVDRHERWLQQIA